jgi:phosphomannomutase
MPGRFCGGNDSGEEGGKGMKFKKTDAAIIFGADLSIQMVIPEIDPVPDHVITATVLSILLSQNDKSLARLIKKAINKFDKYVDQKGDNL